MPTPPRIPPTRPLPGRRRLLIALTLLVAACGGDDPFRPRASLPNAERSYALFSLTGAPGLPAAIDFLSDRVVIPEVVGQSANFDLAFDIDRQGRVTVLPARLVASPPNAPAQLQLQVVSGTFEALTRAPTSGYVTDSTRTLAVGQVLAIQLPTPQAVCVFQEPYYGKLVVDSIIPATRRLVIRTIINRNCGYRSLSVGLPTD